MAFALKLRVEDHTLTDAEADGDIQSILALLEREHQAILR